MLPPSAAVNHSGNSVTTLIASIGLLHREELVAPARYGLPRRHPREPQQPLAVIRPPPRQDERPRQHALGFVHHEQRGLGHEHRTGILHEGKHRHLPPLAVRLAQPPDYAVDAANTPAFFRSDRTVSLGVAPFASHAIAWSLSTCST